MSRRSEHTSCSARGGDLGVLGLGGGDCWARRAREGVAISSSAGLAGARPQAGLRKMEVLPAEVVVLRVARNRGSTSVQYSDLGQD